ncbi:uncharacterized protein BJX67DRAFT_348413, partial [Aspergillus lucknowensis]
MTPISIDSMRHWSKLGGVARSGPHFGCLSSKRTASWVAVVNEYYGYEQEMMQINLSLEDRFEVRANKKAVRQEEESVLKFCIECELCAAKAWKLGRGVGLQNSHLLEKGIRCLSLGAVGDFRSCHVVSSLVESFWSNLQGAQLIPTIVLIVTNRSIILPRSLLGANML